MKILELCQKLTEEIPAEQIHMNEPMSKHTSFKVGGNADIFVKIKNIEELKYVIKVARKTNNHITIIGNGSNVLVRDKGIRGFVLNIDFKDIKIEDAEDNSVIVTAGAGVNLAFLSHELMNKGITGFEFASGIPGSIGGAIKMNAGAFGTEMKDIVISTKCLDLKKYDKLTDKTYIDDIELEEILKKSKKPEIVELTNEEQEFSYRNSVFCNRRYVILETKFKLQHGKTEEIKNKMEEIAKLRKDTQPSFPSAGSTFKRGDKYITAKLIDECGLKGKQIGGAKVSEKHAGFIINTGDATAQDIIDLINYVKDEVFKKTGKVISLEIEIIGE